MFHRKIQWILLLIVWLGLASRVVAEDTKVGVYGIQDKNGITLFAKLENCTEATITVNAKLENMTSSAPLPLTVDAAGRKDFALVTFTLNNPDKTWQYSWSYSWKVGARLHNKPAPYIYSLPYKGGPYKVVQGPYGKFSHYRGSQDEQAIDWAMPEGTQIYPARPGTVVAFRQDCSKGGPDLSYKPDFNYILIKHDDGTFAEYAHLKQNGVLVHLGDHVDLDQPMGLSGNTGYTTGPHLHFVVFYTLNGTTRKTIPVKFKSRMGETIKLQEGKCY